MNRSKISVGMVGLAIMIGMAVQCFGETEKINPVAVSTRSINLYGNEPLKIHSTNVTSTAAQLNAAGGGTTATLTPTTVTASGLIKTYGYSVDVSSNASVVYMTQSGTMAPDAAAPTTTTNKFTPHFIATPQVFVQQLESGVTNNFTIAISTSAFTIVSSDAATWKTNACWMARGRIK